MKKTNDDIMNLSEKQKVLADAISQIEKNYGKGSLMKLGERTSMNIDVIPTGSLTLDMALGVGGIPRSRIIEIYGPESSGKTTLALHMIAEAQKLGGIAGFIDAEHALDPVYAKKIGVDIDNLYISQPDNGEQGLDIAEMMIRSGAMDIIVIDSVAALVPKAEIEGDMTDAQMGLHARMMSKGLRRITSMIGRSNCVVIFINQLREKIGMMFGNPEVTTGGRALKFYSTIRIEVRRGDIITEDGTKSSTAIGHKVKTKVVKNKVAPPFKEAIFDILFGKGIYHESCLLDLGTKFDIINKSGSWYSYNGDKIGQGQDKAKLFLAENKEIANEIEDKIRDIIAKQNNSFEDEEITDKNNYDEKIDSIDNSEDLFDLNV